MSKRVSPLAFSILPLLASTLTAQDPPTNLDPEQGCTTNCHQDLTRGVLLHDPLKEGACDDCHMQADETLHRFGSIDNVQGLCALCHELEMEANVHSPVADGDCMLCHDPHTSQARSLLRAPNEQTLCSVCHGETVAKTGKAFVHGPAAAGKCTLCHDAHSSPEAMLLDAESVDYCLKCHEHQATALDEAENIHAPVLANCASCHDPHGGDHPFMISGETRSMCLGCHEELATSIDEAVVEHGAINTGRTCLSCHLPHVSRFPKMLEQDVKESCLQCHQQSIERSGKRPVAAIGDLLGKSKFLHGPIREGDCTGCHQPHASAHVDLLHKEYPALFYAPYKTENYEICFNCHDQKVFETATTDSLTGFRDGDVNLHFVHVAREKKGRTCRACHEVHGSNLPHHMATTVPFGEWDMPIEYRQLPSGGSCAPGCHKTLQYDRDKPIGDGQGDR